MIERFKNRNIDYERIFNESIILIGPVGVGKSTISNILLAKSGLAYVGMDNLSEYYLNHYGYDIEKGKKLVGFKKYLEYLRYRQPFNFLFTKGILDNIDRPSLIEFGGSDTITTSEREKEELKSSLEEFKNIILLLPSKSKSESLKILNERMKKEKNVEFLNYINGFLITNETNEEYATDVVYTEGKTPDEVVDEILKIIEEKRYTM